MEMMGVSSIDKMIQKHRTYRDDYDRLILMLGSKFPGNAQDTLQRWNKGVFGELAESYWLMRMGLK